MSAVLQNFCLCLAFYFCFFSFSSLFGFDEILLDSGEVIQGHIVKQNASNVSILDDKMRTFTFDLSEIAKIIFQANENKYYLQALVETNTASKKRLLERSLQVLPDDRRAVFYLTRLHFKDGLFKEAETILKNRDLGDPEAQILLALGELYQGHYSKVLTYGTQTNLSQWKELQKDKIILLKNFARALSGHSDQALNDYRAMSTQKIENLNDEAKEFLFNDNLFNFIETLRLVEWAKTFPQEKTNFLLNQTNFVRFLKECPMPPQGWIQDRLVGLPFDAHFDRQEKSTNRLVNWPSLLERLRKHGGISVLESLTLYDKRKWSVQDQTKSELLTHLAQADLGKLSETLDELNYLATHDKKKLGAWNQAWAELGLKESLAHYQTNLPAITWIDKSLDEFEEHFLNKVNLRRYWHSQAPPPPKGWVENRDIKKIYSTYKTESMIWGATGSLLGGLIAGTASLSQKQVAYQSVLNYQNATNHFNYYFGVSQDALFTFNLYERSALGIGVCSLGFWASTLTGRTALPLSLAAIGAASVSANELSGFLYYKTLETTSYSNYLSISNDYDLYYRRVQNGTLDANIHFASAIGWGLSAIGLESAVFFPKPVIPLFVACGGVSVSAVALIIGSIEKKKLAAEAYQNYLKVTQDHQLYWDHYQNLLQSHNALLIESFSAVSTSLSFAASAIFLLLSKTPEGNRLTFHLMPTLSGLAVVGRY